MDFILYIYYIYMGQILTKLSLLYIHRGFSTNKWKKKIGQIFKAIKIFEEKPEKEEALRSPTK